MERLTDLIGQDAQIIAGAGGLLVILTLICLVLAIRSRRLSHQLIDMQLAGERASETARSAAAGLEAAAAAAAAKAAEIERAASITSAQLVEARTTAQSAIERRQEVEARYSVILRAEDEAQRVTEAATASAEMTRKQAEEQVQLLNQAAVKLTNDIEALRSAYKEKKVIFDRLEEQMALYDERLAFAELGIYEPHFEFTDSEQYKEKIVQVRDRQKAMVSAKAAVGSNTTWTVEGSLSKGQTMINRQIRLTMRAFNNECEAAIANVRWNNVNAMEKRILASAKAIDDANASMSLRINPAFIELKLEELRLSHEYREKIKQEKDERAEASRLSREEQKLLKEAEAARREEERYEALLAQARKEAGADGGGSALQERIARLEADLAAAHSVSERAQAMAEMTKSGYVYIISNIGSFGENVVKIGLTRRLDPDDRVRELGDASVPFLFDTHAMIYSDAAPALENALHTEFADRRINLQNFRKEFFRVSLDEVEEAVARLAPEASFFKDREAQEWHETLARRNETLAALQAKAQRLPETV